MRIIKSTLVAGIISLFVPFSGFAEKVKRGKETLIWLDDANHTPIGVIIKKSRGVI